MTQTPIVKGDIVQVAKASVKKDLIVTDVVERRGVLRAGLAYIGSPFILDTMLPVEDLEFIRSATDEEKRSTAPSG